MARPTRLSVELLETFVTVLECGGDASDAADLLGINQPSMSKRLAMLQPGRRRHPMLAEAWLRRDGKAWQATAEGDRMLPVARDLLNRYRHAIDFTANATQDSPDIWMSCGQTVASTLLPKALQSLRKKRPDARVRVSVMRAEERIEQVSAGLLDFALVTHTEADITRIARQPLEIEPLFEASLMLVLGKRSSKKLRDIFNQLPQKVPLKVLLDLPLILPEPNSGVRRQLEQTLHRKGYDRPLRPVLEIGGWGVIRAAAEEGIGIGLVRRMAAQGTGILTKPLMANELDPPVVRRLICRRGEAEGYRDLNPTAEILFADLQSAAHDIERNDS